MKAESVRIVWEFAKLARSMRAQQSKKGIKNTELELVYEACASSVERVIDEVREIFHSTGH